MPRQRLKAQSLNWAQRFVVMNNTLEIFGLKLEMVGPMWFQNVCTVLFLGVFVWSLFWVANDTKRRGKSPFGAVIFAMLALYPISLFWWVWLRPPLRASNGSARPFVLGN